MRTSLLLTFLILSLLFILVLQQPSQYKGKNVKGAIIKVYGFKLALQWPNAYCNTGYQNCELPVPQKFKIHGFWPVDNNGQVMHNEDQFGRNYLKEEDVADVKEELDEMWPDLRHEKQKFYFWAEEWRKHGNDIGYTPNSYFKLALLSPMRLGTLAPLSGRKTMVGTPLQHPI
ncbi:unnamed protein product [Fraxinus pennsylvanica]|uniref:Uncharacterized protein n=1 Tax=Fraxinus pennsylvanica TaxID=56036 RepID=A0AAD1ZS06_9LAMI|nr:unnamed protein product [Fraxinus pennsylvanica]